MGDSRTHKVAASSICDLEHNLAVSGKLCSGFHAATSCLVLHLRLSLAFLRHFRPHHGLRLGHTCPFQVSVAGLSRIPFQVWGWRGDRGVVGTVYWWPEGNRAIMPASLNANWHGVPTIVRSKRSTEVKTAVHYACEPDAESITPEPSQSVVSSEGSDDDRRHGRSSRPQRLRTPDRRV
jgi:hypothetical protein